MRSSVAVFTKETDSNSVEREFESLQSWLFSLNLTWFGTKQKTIKKYEKDFSDIIILSVSEVSKTVHMFLTDSSSYQTRKHKYNIEKGFCFPEDKDSIQNWLITKTSN